MSITPLIVAIVEGFLRLQKRTHAAVAWVVVHPKDKNRLLNDLHELDMDPISGSSGYLWGANVVIKDVGAIPSGIVCLSTVEEEKDMFSDWNAFTAVGI